MSQCGTLGLIQCYDSDDIANALVGPDKAMITPNTSVTPITVIRNPDAEHTTITPATAAKKGLPWWAWLLIGGGVVMVVRGNNRNN